MFFNCDNIFIRGEVIGHDTVINHEVEIIIDTCYTYDTGEYETGIKVGDDKWVVVEYYDDPELAKLNHDLWVHAVTCDEFKLESEQIDLTLYFNKGETKITIGKD